MACGQKSFSTTVKTVMLRLGFSCQAPLTDPWAQCCLHDHCRARRYATPRKVRTDFGISTTGLERQIQASVDKRPGLRAFRQTLAWWDTELPESVMSYWTPNQSCHSSPHFHLSGTLSLAQPRYSYSRTGIIVRLCILYTFNLQGDSQSTLSFIVYLRTSSASQPVGARRRRSNTKTKLWNAQGRS
jgi:hypothetical protein